MLLKYHEKFTSSILRELNLNNEEGLEILKGSLVNDLCELTNEYTTLHNNLENYLKSKEEKRIFESFAFYQSHWGHLSALHSMAEYKGVEAIDTQIKILNWLNFLEFILFNVDEEILDLEINRFDNILGDSVKKLKFKISSLLDTHYTFRAKYRALGMIIHIIEDSYTISHCKRVPSGI